MDVDPVQTRLGDPPLGLDDFFRSDCRRGSAVNAPRLHDSVCQVATDLYEESPRAARGVADLQLEQHLRFSNHPLGLRKAIVGPQVQERGERVANHLLRQ